MLKRAEDYDSIYVATGYTDLRHNINGLTVIIKQSFKLDPFSNSLFLFCNKKRNRLKAVVWDKNGFVMLYKRLDGKGAKFRWPKTPEQVRGITSHQLNRLLEGFSIDTPRGFGEVTARIFY